MSLSLKNSISALYQRGYCILVDNLVGFRDRLKSKKNSTSGQVRGEIINFVNAIDSRSAKSNTIPYWTNRHRTGFDHYRLIRPSDSGFRIQDTITSGIGKTQKFRMLWVFDNHIDLVVHGQGFEAVIDGIKILDINFEANVSTSTKFYSEFMDQDLVDLSPAKRVRYDRKTVVVVQFEGAQVSLTTNINSEPFVYRDRGLLTSPEPWSRFVSSVALNYLLLPASSDAGNNILVVAFSAVSGIGDFNFNYRTSLDPTHTNVLYILDDFGDQGSYYLMDHGDHGIFDTVQELIMDIAGKLGVARKNIILIGSSKGGAAAILHGISAGVGHVYVGAPQTRIGSFVSRPHPNILRFMVGAVDMNAVETLDKYLYELVQNTTPMPKISIVVGDADHHYKGHVLPFVDHFKKLNKDIDLEVLPGVPHSEIGLQYRRRLVRYVELVKSSTEGS